MARRGLSAPAAVAAAAMLLCMCVTPGTRGEETVRVECGTSVGDIVIEVSPPAPGDHPPTGGSTADGCLRLMLTWGNSYPKWRPPRLAETSTSGRQRMCDSCTLSYHVFTVRDLLAAVFTVSEDGAPARGDVGVWNVTGSRHGVPGITYGRVRDEGVITGDSSSRVKRHRQPWGRLTLSGVPPPQREREREHEMYAASGGVQRRYGGSGASPRLDRVCGCSPSAFSACILIALIALRSSVDFPCHHQVHPAWSPLGAARYLELVKSGEQ